MKIRTILVILLLMSFSIILASEDPTETDHWEKVRQLDQLAERFKAETGFRGSVDYSTTTMRLHVYQGNFPGITFTADGDTTAFRQACEGIISKVLPNSRASSNQLSMSSISKSGRGYTTEYYQQVDGYRVEGAGYIKITFEDGRKYFAIGDNTVELPSSIEDTVISQEKAEQIALKDMKDSKYQKAKVKSGFFSNMGADAYYLAYLICVSDDSNPIFGDYTYYINAISGKVMLKRRVSFFY